MKAEIDENGCLTVSPENPIEVYALGCWYAGWNKPLGEQTSTLAVDVPTGIPGAIKKAKAIPAETAS